MNFNFRFSDMIGDNFRLHFDDHTDEILKHPLRMFLNVQLFLCLKKRTPEKPQFKFAEGISQFLWIILRQLRWHSVTFIPHKLAAVVNEVCGQLVGNYFDVLFFFFLIWALSRVHCVFYCLFYFALLQKPGPNHVNFSSKSRQKIYTCVLVVKIFWDFCW